MGRGCYSRLMEELKNGRFTFTGEVEPVKTTSLDEVVETAKILRGYVTAINVTDNPAGYAYMNSLVPAYVIQERAGVEAIYQVTCRDRNRIAIFSDILAAAALGIKNILALTGDHPALGDMPQAKPVFDLDACQLVYMIRRMVDEGVDLAGNKIEKPPKIHVGVAANPGANPIEPELLKLEKKVRLGAEFVQTQVVYDIEVARNFLRETRKLSVPVLIGICPLKSYAMAKWMDKYCPGVTVPKELMERVREAEKRGGKEEVYRVNVEVFGEFIRELKKTTSAAGCHIMAVGFEWIVPEIIKASGVKPPT